jgi:hypothetical protein
MVVHACYSVKLRSNDWKERRIEYISLSLSLSLCVCVCVCVCDVDMSNDWVMHALAKA